MYWDIEKPDSSVKESTLTYALDSTLHVVYLEMLDVHLECAGLKCVQLQRPCVMFLPSCSTALITSLYPFGK